MIIYAYPLIWGYYIVKSFFIFFRKRNRHRIPLVCILQVRITSINEKTGWMELFFELTGIDLVKYPVCGTGRMVTWRWIHGLP